MPTVLDPRRVEPRFRLHAAIASCLLIAGVLAVVFREAMKAIMGHRTVELELQNDWGPFPDFGLCAFLEYTTTFRFWSFYASPRVLQDGLSHVVPRKPPYINASILNPDATDSVSRGVRMFSTCLRFETSNLVPKIGNTVAFTLKASFERKQAANEKEDWIEETRSSLSVLAYKNKGNDFAGKLGELIPYRVDAESATMTSFEVQKTRIHRVSGRVSSYFEATAHPIAIEKPVAPRYTITGDKAAELQTGSDPLSEDLLVAAFEILLIQTDEHESAVQSLYYSALWVKLARLLGGAGGLLTLAIFIYRVCFPRKFDKSNVCATNDMRTLRGYKSPLREVLVNGSSCDFGTGCFAGSSTFVETYTSPHLATTELASLHLNRTAL